MTQFANTPDRMSNEEADKMFSAGFSFLTRNAFSAAYECFDLIPVKDFSLLYNKALCCFMVEWYSECHRFLCEAERLISGNTGSGTETLPEAFLRYRYEEESPYCPMPQGTPTQLAYTQILRLKAETAFRLHSYTEVKAISNRLGRKYRHIELLTQNQYKDEK